jgi:DtxR family Mn-dependent transcriptional regulator
VGVAGVGVSRGERDLGRVGAHVRYLEAVWYLRGEKETVRRARLASWLGVSAPAVTEFVNRLVREGLLWEDEHQILQLTEEGERIAEAAVRRHRIVEAWAVSSLGLDWITADEEAQRLAPVVSDVVLERMHALVGRPARCPHGNHIPGEPKEEVPLERLSEAEPPAVVRVERISELAEHDSKAVLGLLMETNVVPGAILQLVSRSEVGEVALRVGNQEHLLPPLAANSVWVALEPASWS